MGYRYLERHPTPHREADKVELSRDVRDDISSKGRQAERLFRFRTSGMPEEVIKNRVLNALEVEKAPARTVETNRMEEDNGHRFLLQTRACFELLSIDRGFDLLNWLR